MYTIRGGVAFNKLQEEITIAALKEKWSAVVAEVPSVAGTFEPTIAAIEKKMQPGDVLRWFTLNKSRGLAIVRNGTVVEAIGFVMA